MTKTLAITGATGFVGQHLVERASARGFAVRALTRRPQPDRVGIHWVEGALDRPESLGRLTEGADAVIHVAGIINARTASEFSACNVDGTNRKSTRLNSSH